MMRAKEDPASGWQTDEPGKEIQHQYNCKNPPGNQGKIDSEIVPLCSGRGQYHSNEPTAQNRKPYLTITMSDIRTMIENPTHLAKQSARWVIFSSLMSRNFKTQREKGLYYACWSDIDHVEGMTFDDIVSRAEKVLLDFWLYNSSSATEETPKC
jgi:hypothetical protein